MQSTLSEYQETQSQEAFALQNSKLLKVSLNQITIQAKLGSMVAYQGDVSFEHAGSGGMGRFIKKAVSGEGTSLMKASGTGEMFLADTAQDIHLIKLENDAITCNGANVLAFDAGIDWDITKVSGGMAGAMAGGLFNMSLQGTGWVAVLSDPAGAAEHRRRAHVRRPAGGHHVVERRVHQHQVRLQGQGPDRQGLGRADADGVPGPGLGPGTAQRGPDHRHAGSGGGGGGGLLGQLGG